MNSHKNLILKSGAFLAALLAGVTARVQASDYSNIYYFGDSLTDSGTFEAIVGSNDHFSTNPGTVWSQNLGASYGKSVTPAYSVSLTPAGFPINVNGNNFATGSARINAQPTNLSPAAFAPLAPFLPSVNTQVTDFFARGPLDPGALYAISGGHNDVFTQLDATQTPDAARAAIVTAANDLTTLVTRLQSGGARNVIVLGIMDITKTPIGTSQPADKAALLSSLMTDFNATLATGLAGKNLLYFDTGKLLNTVIANPSAYGFTNTTDAAVQSSLGNVPPPSTDGYLFADIRHPSARFHRIMSDWIYSSLQAANRAALFSMLPMRRSGTQWLTIDNRLQAFQNFGYRGQGFFVSGDYANAYVNSSDGAPSSNSSGGGFVLGYEKALTDRLFSGVTLGYGHKPFDLGNNQGSLNYDEWALSAFASHKFGAFYANVLTSYSWLDFESTRNVALGQQFKIDERGDTNGDQFGVKGQIGYNFTIGNIVHGPIAGLTWERVTVDGFNEKSGSVTAMSFGDQVRESLRSRAGWQAASEIKWSGAKIRPFAQLSYDFEHLKDERNYRVGFVGGGTSGIDMYTANQTGGYGTLLVGVNTELSKTIRVGINGSTTISQPGADNVAVNAMLGVSF